MKYHYIFSGLGLSSLLALHEMMQNNLIEGKSILIIEPETKEANDRTWCFWERGSGDWDHLLTKQWKSAFFLTENDKIECLSNDMRYKMMESKSFYHHIITVLKSYSNIVFVKDFVISFEERQSEVTVKTQMETFVTEYFFNSVSVIDDVTSQTKYPLLKQHFIGWFIKTQNPVFSPESVYFMDFSVDQRENTRFMYVLPFSATEALVEYTLFSPKELEDNEYEAEIKNYIVSKGAQDFEVIAKERGVIPMTTYPFWKKNTKRILHIGTAGGWTKASTGYTFKNATKQAKKLVEVLKQESIDFRFFEKKNRFLFYDSLFVSVLYDDNSLGKEIFSKMFTKVSPNKILRFLDEESTFKEELEIIWTCPKLPFIKALVKYLFA